MKWLYYPTPYENMGDCDFKGCVQYDMGDCFMDFCLYHGEHCLIFIE